MGRSFDSGNQILYQPNQMWGYLGDKILVNGLLNAALPLEPRAYRLRLLNGSNARTYKLAWSNGMPLKVIGTMGGGMGGGGMGGGGMGGGGMGGGGCGSLSNGADFKILTVNVG